MIAVIGQGFVGGSLTTVFSERNQKVFVYDKAGKSAPGGISSFSVGEQEVIPSSLGQFIECVEMKEMVVCIRIVKPFVRCFRNVMYFYVCDSMS